MATEKRFTNATGSPVADNTNIMTAGRRGPALLQDIWLIEKLAHFDREVIPERRMHAKGWGAYGTLPSRMISHTTPRPRFFRRSSRRSRSRARLPIGITGWTTITGSSRAICSAT